MQCLIEEMVCVGGLPECATGTGLCLQMAAGRGRRLTGVVVAC